MERINGRFAFDNSFRWLLQNGYSRDEAKEFIMNNYSLSALVIQERIENQFYKNILPFEKVSKDLMKLKDEIYGKFFCNKN